MKKILMITSLVAGALMSSCTTEEIDPNIASNIVGTYAVDTYVTQSGESTGDLSTNKVIITRVDDTHIDVLIDYPSDPDVELDNCLVTSDGDKYSYNQAYSNAEMEGTVLNDNLTLDITYTSGSYLNITASK